MENVKVFFLLWATKFKVRFEISKTLSEGTIVDCVITNVRNNISIATLLS